VRETNGLFGGLLGRLFLAALWSSPQSHLLVRVRELDDVIAVEAHIVARLARCTPIVRVGEAAVNNQR